MPTLTAASIPTLVDELRRLGVKTSVFSLPAFTAVPECRYRDHAEVEAAIVDLYPVDGPHTEVCPDCAARIALDTDIRAIDIKRITYPTVIAIEDVFEPEARPGRVTVVDSDARFITVDTADDEFLVKEAGDFSHLVRLDMSTAGGIAAATVLRDALNAAIAQAA